MRNKFLIISDYPLLELSDMEECLLVMENLSVRGFRGGPRLELDFNHLALMTRKIAEYHSAQFAMRILNDPKLEVLKSGITPLPWKSNSLNNVFEVIYRAAFDRMFSYLDANPEFHDTQEMREEVNLLREKFGKDPVSFLELFRQDDPAYSVIQHGDYNRNNVLFQYSPDNPETPTDLRMIDFQETRYGSPAFDLFFFYYMSSTSELREKHWDELLHLYHDSVWGQLKKILNCDDSDERLGPYTYDNFQKHFARFAFYGTMVTIHFLPWMDADPEEVKVVNDEFTRNMMSDKCRDLLLKLGGEVSDRKVALALQHACSRGYLSFIRNI